MTIIKLKTLRHIEQKLLINFIGEMKIIVMKERLDIKSFLKQMLFSENVYC
jgi:hypothetical protein